MSPSSPEDDFFGIEHMRSSFSVSGEKTKEEIESITPAIESSEQTTVIMPSRLSIDETAMEKDDHHLSGTEYFDRAFFQKDGITDKGRENEHPSGFFEECFFRGVKYNENSVDQKRIKRRKTVGISKKSDMDIPSELHQSGDIDDEGKSYLQDWEVAHLSEEKGIDRIREQFIPVWRMNENELVNLMAGRVLFKNDDIVAFDKPYGMAYSGASRSTPQLDRLLQKIKASVLPKCERLYLVKSLDRYQSGIVLFATNAAAQSALKEEIRRGVVEHVTRCIVRDQLKDSPLKITIPLIKTVKNRDLKLLPLIANSTKGEIFYVESDCRTVQGRQFISSVEVRTRKEVPHQIRAHLALACCPLIGDSKYNNSSPRTPRLSHHVLNSLNVTDSQSRKIPMYLHLKEMHFPAVLRSSAPIHISAPMPRHFLWMLKKLNLLKARR